MDAYSWKTWKKLRCFRRFIDFKCVVAGHENMTTNPLTFDVSFLDEDKMMAVILDCVESLCVVQKERKEQLAIRIAKNKLFKLVLARIGFGLIDRDDGEVAEPNVNIERLKAAFPDVFKGKDSRTWLPLHWGVLLIDTPESKSIGFTQTDLKVIYTDDPLALQRHHVNSIWGHALRVDGCGFNPAQLLCMQPMTEQTMSMIRYFSDCNPCAFTMSAKYMERWDDPDFSFSALHAVCRYGQPSGELLQHLLQLDGGQALAKKSFPLGETPLEYLFRNEAYRKEMLHCLLEVNNSYEVVGSGLSYLLAFEHCLQLSLSDHASRLLEMFECLLHANPAAAKYRTSLDILYPPGSNLLHIAASHTRMPSAVSIQVMRQILKLHPDAIQEVQNGCGWIPVQRAARDGSVEVLAYLLDAYPESASIIAGEGWFNLLHLAIADDTSESLVKTKFLCSRYPAMMYGRDDKGLTPLLKVLCLTGYPNPTLPNLNPNPNVALPHPHLLLPSSNDILMKQIDEGFCQPLNVPVVMALCECGGSELVKTTLIHPIQSHFPFNHWSPLHFLICFASDSLTCSLVSKEADCFRLLLRLHPEAAGIEGGLGVGYTKTPIQLAYERRFPAYYFRLLLNAVPSFQPTEINWVERRMAMFLAYKAISKQVKPLLLKRLSKDKDILKHVISFL